MTAPFKRILVLDYETRWARKPTDWCETPYTLSSMTTEEYIRSPHFYAFGMCIHEFGSPLVTQWYSHDEIPKILATYDWKTTAIMAQNASFDGAILSMIYDVHPCFIIDTLSMARALRGVEVGNSLAKLAEEFGLPAKGQAVYSTEGLHSLTPEIERELAEYCKHDVFLCEEVFKRLQPGYPAKELRLIDMTIKMYTEPQFVLDKEMLQQALDEDKEKLRKALELSGADEAELASNPQFAEVLKRFGVEPPTKISKTTGKETLALAKNDALFQALLNGDNEDVALLCEARLRVKSTIERTRAQRFLDIAGRGPLPIPLSYYGANSGRWSAAKGASINVQNMKRGSALRKAIMAPDGYLVCAGDLSQIEPRVLAWLSDYDAMLDTFRAGGDPYAVFGAQMFSIPGMTKESNPLLRQSAKSAMLGCFGRDTPVLTANGYKPIVEVISTDLLWDGVQWVQHQGVVAQGEKAVDIAYGVAATPDHKILVKGEWTDWRAVHTNRSLFKQALSSATLPALNGEDAFQGSTNNMRRGCAACADTKASLIQRNLSKDVSNGAVSVVSKIRGPQLNTDQRRRSRLTSERSLDSLSVLLGKERTIRITHECVAYVVGKVSYIARTFSTGAARVVEAVHTQPLFRQDILQKAITTFAPMRNIVTGFLTVSAPLLCGAQTQRALFTQTMAGAGSAYTQNGYRTGSNSYATSSAYRDGTSQSFNWTASTITQAMCRATCALSHAARTWLTNARSLLGKSSNCADASLPLRQRMQTYDIALAGPRNRYTILTSEGPLIVHNCGYSLGWSSFAAQLLVGFLGAPPVRYTKADAKQLGVTAQDVMDFTHNAKYMEKMADIPHTCTEQELLIHCLASKAIIDKYRKAAAPVVGLWNLLGNLLETCICGGREYNHKGVATFRKDEMVLVNGMSIRYPDTRMEPDENGRPQYTFAFKGKRKKIYSGLLANNLTQGTARIVMSDGLLRVQKRFPVKGTVHDEGLFLIPDDENAQANADWIKEQMIQVPTWMPGIPLNADVGFHKRYGLAKG